MPRSPRHHHYAITIIAGKRYECACGSLLKNMDELQDHISNARLEEDERAEPKDHDGGADQVQPTRVRKARVVR